MAIALTLALHELATNAAKYGALSVEGGCVRVRWRVESGRNLSIRWEETGGPPAAEPRRRGFGSRLVEGVVTGELGGKLDRAFVSSGFSATMLIPADAYIRGISLHDA